MYFHSGDIRALVAVAVDSVKFAVKELLKEHGENISTLQKGTNTIHSNIFPSVTCFVML